MLSGTPLYTYSAEHRYTGRGGQRNTATWLSAERRHPCMVSGKPLYMTDSEQRSTHAQRNAAIRDASQRSTAIRDGIQRTVHDSAQHRYA